MSYVLLEDYEDVEIQVTTSNPERKYKKKLRKLKEKYKKKPSTELSIKISEVEKMLNELDKHKTVIKKKVRKKLKKVDKSLKYVNRKRSQFNNTRKVCNTRKVINYDEYSEKTKSPFTSYNDICSNRIENDFMIRKQKIKDKFYRQFFKMNDYKTSIITTQIWWYLRNPNKEGYTNLMKKYSGVGLKNIQKTIYKVLYKLPEDIIKIIWKYYFESKYYKTGILIEKFKKEIDNEKDIYNNRKKLYY
tara:strand:- start:1170 stop:1907 length:738 start_codon:yes stop_codon:yes gene_type:complete